MFVRKINILYVYNLGKNVIITEGMNSLLESGYNKNK